MKKAFQLKNIVASIALASAAATMAPVTTAQAGEVSYNMAISNMYLWRGQDISNSGTVSGGVDYAMDSGVGLGMWTSSEDAGGSEFDLYATYGFSAGGVDLSVGYFAYLYPSDGVDSFSTDNGGLASEYMIGAGFGDASATIYINTDDTSSTYTSLDYSMGKVGLHLGLTAGGSEYTDYNVSYAATDAMSITVSMASGDDAPVTNPLVAVSYSLPL